MPGPQPRLHLPSTDWPEVDRQMWNNVVNNDDPFADGLGARLSKITLHKYWMGWRRFLGFLTIVEPDALENTPAKAAHNRKGAAVCRTSQGNQYAAFSRHPDGQSLWRSSYHDAGRRVELVAGYQDPSLFGRSPRQLRPAGDHQCAARRSWHRTYGGMRNNGKRAHYDDRCRTVPRRAHHRALRLRPFTA